MSRPDAKYDARGLGCPLLMIGLNKVINGMSIGDVLEMVSDEDVSRLDVPSWCRRTGHELVDMTEKEGEFLFIIRKCHPVRNVKRKRDFTRY